MAKNLFSVLHFPELISFSEGIGKMPDQVPEPICGDWSVHDLAQVVQNLHFRLANMLIRV
jgi:hypothetical protein